MQNPFKNPTNSLTLIISATSAIIGVVLYEAIQEYFAAGVLESRTFILVFNLVCLGFFLILFSHTVGRIENLYKTRRLSIRYIPIDGRDGKELYVEAAKFIEEAKEDGTGQIFAVNSFLEVFKESEDEAREEYRKMYLSTIERKIGKVDYHRVIQVKYSDEENINIADRISKNYADHYKHIIEARANSKNNKITRIDVAPALYPESFVVISNQNQTNYLIWQISKHVPNPDKIEAVKLTGVFLIVDPDEQIVKYFKDWFVQISNNKELRALTAKDISN